MDQFAQFLPIILIVLIFVFLVIIPGRKQRKERDAFIEGLKSGDKVLTNQGIYGEIIAVNNKIVTLEIAEKTKIKILQDGINRLQTKAEQDVLQNRSHD